MRKKHLATYSVSFLHTYSTTTKNSKGTPRTVTRTVHRHKTVEASNVSAAIAKARRGIGPGGFSKFQVQVFK